MDEITKDEEEKQVTNDDQFSFTGDYLGTRIKDQVSYTLPETEEDKLSWGEALHEAGVKTWIPNVAYRELTAEDFDPDPSFVWTNELTEKYTSGLGDEFQNYVTEAKSAEEAAYRYHYARERQTLYEDLTQSGWDKTLAAGVVSAFDPAEIAAVTAVTMGWGNLVTIPKNAYKAYDRASDALQFNKRVYRNIDELKDAQNAKKKFKQGAAKAVATVLPFEAYKTAYLPEWDEGDLGLVLATAGAFGGLVEGVPAYFNKLRNMEYYRRRTAPGMPDLTDRERLLFNDIIGTDGVDRTLKQMDDFNARLADDSDGLNLEAIDFDNPDKYVGSAEQLGTNNLFLTFGLRNRVSAVANAMSSKNPIIRNIGERMGLNSSGKRDRTAVPYSALEWQAWVQNTSTARAYTQWRKSAQQFAEQNGQSWSAVHPLKNIELEMSYMEEVTKAVRRGGSDNPLIQQGAEIWIKEQRELLTMAKNAKVRGAADVNFDDLYVPRITDDAKWDGFLLKYGEEELVKLLKGAIKAKQGDDLADELLDEIAEGYVKGVTSRVVMRQTHSADLAQMGIFEDGLSQIREGLMAKYGDEKMVDDIMAQVEEVFPEVAKKGGEISRLKRRVDLDETFTMKIGKDEVSFEDLLNNDMRHLHTLYTYQMGGAIGLARNGFERDGMESFSGMLDRLRREGVKEGIPGVNRNKQAAKRNREINSLEFMYDGITGRLAHTDPFVKSEKARKWARRVREYNFIRSMGASGIPTMVETMATLFEHSAKTIFQGVPRLRKMIKKMENGQLEDDLFREMQHATGVGTDMLTGRVRAYFDDYETDLVQTNYGKADAYLAAGRQFTATASGMLPLTAMMRRADSMFYAMDWFNAAAKGKKSPFSAIKMEQMGLSPSDTQLIYKYIKKFADKDSKGKLKTLNLDKWKADGKEGNIAWTKFSQSASRHALQSVQETNLGSVNRFLRSETGKTAGQFLSYVFAAQEQQFQRHLARMFNGDFKSSAFVLMMSAFMSTMAYVTGVYYRSTGMSDKRRKRYLKDRLAPHRIFVDGTVGYLGATSFQLTGWQRFREANLIQNPTFDVLRLYQEGTGAIWDHATGQKDLNEAALRRLIGLMPIPTSWYPLGMAANWSANQMTK